MENRITQGIPAQTLADALKKVQEARALLAPYLISLTPTSARARPRWATKPWPSC